MEQLLRGEKISEIGKESNQEAIHLDSIMPFEQVYNLQNPVLYFPVRHHSPVCAYHLKRAIEDYCPECILIEGPQNAEELISVLAHQDTKAPLALYYYYKDSKGLLSEDKEDYRCYYPFLDCSPEMVALREASSRNIPAHFIDLSYGEILLHTVSGKGIRKEAEKQNYSDDYLLSRSQYLKLLCEKTKMRDFEEFWEKYFEIDGLTLPTQEFVRRMFLYCCLSRIHTPDEELQADGCLCREQFMAQQIAEISTKYQKTLVVTGGFHTFGLLHLLKPKKNRTGLQFVGEKVTLHKISEKDQGVYPLAYSMQAADALNGYASGMQSPGFYQKVWEQFTKTGETKGAYEAAVLHQLIYAGRKARKKKESLSSYDIICALSMARGLASLRGKQEPGLYELQDAALSSFVKGELSLSTDLPLRILQELNTGSQVGSLCADALRPPILNDFEEQCKKFALQIQAASKKEVTLEIFTKQKHMAASRFFYQMEFLETGFASRKKGSDLLGRKDRSRVREVWTYQFSSKVLSTLVDVSMSGSTVKEAAHAQLISKFKKSTGSREAARFLVQSFLMGFLEDLGEMEDHAHEVLATDGDFFSLAESFSYFKMLSELIELYQYETENGEKLDKLLSICFQKIIQLLPSMAQVSEDHQQECMESCLNLYQMTGKKNFEHYRPVLMDAFLRLIGKKDIQPGLFGAVLGLLYGYDGQYADNIQQASSGFLKGSKEMRMKSAAFLRGLFFTARDFVFVQETFLEMIDELVAALGAEDFLQLLPEFRMAFGYFTPLETDRIAQKAAALHGAEKLQFLTGREVSPLEYEYGEILDIYGTQILEEKKEDWGE